MSGSTLKLGGREPFQIPAGTQALKRTINCSVMDVSGELVATLRISGVLGAVVLKAPPIERTSRTVSVTWKIQLCYQRCWGAHWRWCHGFKGLTAHESSLCITRSLTRANQRGHGLIMNSDSKANMP